MPDQSPHLRRRLWKRPAFWIVLCLVMFLMTPYVIYQFTSRLTQERIERTYAELRAAGKPTNAAELDAYYRIPEGRTDATELWTSAVTGLVPLEPQELVRTLPIVGVDDSEIPWVGDPWEQQGDVETLLEAYQPNLDAAGEAAAVNGLIRRDYDFQQGFSLLIPEVQNSRTLLRLLVLEANVQARRGDVDGTMRSLKCLAALSESLENEPTVVGVLVSLAADGITSETLVKLLPHVDFNDDQLTELQALMRESHHPGLYRHVIMVERAAGLMALNGEDPSVPISPLSAPDELVVFARLMADLESTADASHEVRMATATAVDVQRQKLVNNWIGRLRYALLAMIFVPHHSLSQAHTRNQAQSLCASTAVAVERFRRQHGKLPEQLDDLVPKFLKEVPTDPYDQQPLRYVLTPTGCIIYALGDNGVDDGGSIEFLDDVGYPLHLTKPPSNEPSRPIE